MEKKKRKKKMKETGKWSVLLFSDVIIVIFVYSIPEFLIFFLYAVFIHGGEKHIFSNRMLFGWDIFYVSWTLHGQ